MRIFLKNMVTGESKSFEPSTIQVAKEFLVKITGDAMQAQSIVTKKKHREIYLNPRLVRFELVWNQV